MSMERSINSGKDRRKPYRGSESVDSSCRNHGSCPWCKGNRKHKNIRRSPILSEET